MLLFFSFPPLPCHDQILKFASLNMIILFQESICSTYIICPHHAIIIHTHTCLHTYIDHLISFNIVRDFLECSPSYGVSIIHLISYASSDISALDAGFLDCLFFLLVGFRFHSIFQCCRREVWLPVSLFFFFNSLFLLSRSLYDLPFILWGQRGSQTIIFLFLTIRINNGLELGAPFEPLAQIFLQHGEIVFYYLSHDCPFSINFYFSL